MSDVEELAVVGKPLPKRDARIKVTGDAKYGADIRLPGMLHGKLLRSPHAHARIIKIDADAALKVKGVRAVVTGADFPGIPYGNFPHTRDYLPLALDKVRYIGEEVAAVAADDEDAAWEALELIRVEYEPLRAVFDPEEAVREGAPLLYDDRPGNLSSKAEWGYGDVEKGFQESDYVREETFNTQPVKHGMLETHACVGLWDGQGKITLWSCKQSPYIVWRQLGNGLGIPPSRIRIIQTYVGAGNSGGKQEAMPMDFAAVMLSRKTGRPVRIVHTMEEVLIIGHMRHPFTIRLKMGVKKDGSIHAVQYHVISDGGAHSSIGQLSIFNPGMYPNILYKIPNFRYDAYRIYTNKSWAGAMRGHGSPQTFFAFESMLDMLAHDLGMDEIAMRRKNGVSPGHVANNGIKITSCALHECIDKAEELSGWQQKKGKLPKNRGIGIGCAGFISGPGIMGHAACAAMLKINEDGRIALLTGATDVGQGADTVLSMIAAEVLGTRLEDVSFALVDSDITPLDPGTWGSRVTFCAGNAVYSAALDAKKQLAEVAAGLLQAKEEELVFRNRKVFVKAQPEREVALERLIKHCQDRLGRPIMGRGFYRAPWEVLDFSKGYGNVAPAYSFYAQVFEVEVDPETGKVDIVNVITVHDGGRILNPMLARGQLTGSLIMHQGHTLFEDLIRDRGKTLNPSFMNYKMMTSMDIPRSVSFYSVGGPDAEGPFGAKECGEGSASPSMGGLANAIADAIGVRFKDLPITPEKIVKALRTAENKEGDHGH
jgi:4-hydroxybenzoyl-CoA reductase alpha subunit